MIVPQILTEEEIKYYKDTLKELKEEKVMYQQLVDNIYKKIDTLQKEFQSKCSHSDSEDNDFFGINTCNVCGKILI